MVYKNCTLMSRIASVIWKHPMLRYPLMPAFLFLISKRNTWWIISYYFKKVCRNFLGSRWVVKTFSWRASSKRTLCVLFGKSKYTKWENKHDFNTSGFYSANKKLKSQKSRCIYCLVGDHPPSHCSKVTNVNSRKKVLRKHLKYFICLKSRHLAKKCFSKYVCQKCNQKHHISICTKD